MGGAGLGLGPRGPGDPAFSFSERSVHVSAWTRACTEGLVSGIQRKGVIIKET